MYGFSYACGLFKLMLERDSHMCIAAPRLVCLNEKQEKNDRSHQTSIVVGTLLYIMNTESIVYICFRERTRLLRPTDWLD